MMQLVKSAAKQVRKDLAVQQGKGNKKVKKPKLKWALRGTQFESSASPSFAAAGAAYSMKSTIPVGMSDVKNHRISWLVGYVWVGNGTLGAQDSIYFVDPTKTDTVVPYATYGNGVPIASGDSLVGATYASDVEKHYARKVVHRQILSLRSLSKNTGNGMVVVIACRRGAADIGQAKTDATAGMAYTNVISMSGYKSAGSWEDLDIDATSCIAGGSGSQQNEFDVNANFGNATIVGGYGTYARGIVPSTFVVSGNNTTSGLRGTATHAVICTQFVSMLDYVGGDADLEPIEVMRCHADRVRRSVLNPENRGFCSIPVSLAKKSSNDVDGGERKSYLPPSTRDVLSSTQRVADDVRSIDGRDGMPGQPPTLLRQKGYVVVERTETGTAGRPQSAK